MINSHFNVSHRPVYCDTHRVASDTFAAHGAALDRSQLQSASDVCCPAPQPSWHLPPALSMMTTESAHRGPAHPGPTATRRRRYFQCGGQLHLQNCGGYSARPSSPSASSLTMRWRAATPPALSTTRRIRLRACDDGVAGQTNDLCELCKLCFPGPRRVPCRNLMLHLYHGP
jgi:hypothetical protein